MSVRLHKRRPLIGQGASMQTNVTSFECPHCGVLQALTARQEAWGPVSLTVLQCRNCDDVTITGSFYGISNKSKFHDGFLRLYPSSSARVARQFKFAPAEVAAAYGEACALATVHTGAAGAYARRALELILDQAGYTAKTLSDSIDLARRETDHDRRLTRTLLLKFDYVKEIGNFALHVRRDDELAIVPIDDVEVETCLTTIEDLIQAVFEDPGLHYEQAVALNEKLRAVGKKEATLPPLPPGYTLPAEALEQVGDEG